MSILKNAVGLFGAAILAAGIVTPVDAQTDPPDEPTESIEAVDDFDLVPTTGTSIIDVTGNDSDDSDDNDVVVTIVSPPQIGSATVGVDGDEPVVEYTPNAGAAGIDTFGYEACVDGSCDTAVATIYVGTSGCTIVGTNGADTLTGTEGDDVICGRKGHDIINALGGNDIVFGGRGRDTIDGGDGDDILRGKGGRDTIVGGAGNDLIRGGRGNDVLSGGPGNDAMYGGTGEDIMDGGPGDDVLYGRQHADVLHGGAGNDDLRGNRGADTLDGGPGTDSLNGAKGNDVCTTGETYVKCETGDNPSPSLVIDYPVANATIFDTLQVAVSVTDPPDGAELVVSVNGTEQASFDRSTAALIVDLVGFPEGPVTVVVELREGSETLATKSVNVELQHLSPTTGLSDLFDKFESGEITVDEYLVNGMQNLVAATQSGTVDPDDEFTTQVLALALQLWPDASEGARHAIIDLNTVTVSDNTSSSGLKAAAVSCPMTTGINWGLGLIGGLGFGSDFCEYKVDPDVIHEDFIPEGVDRSSLTEIDFLIDPSLDGLKIDRSGDDLVLSNDVIPSVIGQAAKRMWEAEALFESYGLDLPEVHRNDGVPIHVFIVANSYPAYSSPFNERDGVDDVINWVLNSRRFGHPIRVSGPELHLDKVIVHEFFHTFEWDTINWTNDVALGSETGRTVALYESAANWGTQEYSVREDKKWAFHFNKSLDQWLFDPSQKFLHSESGLFDISKKIPSIAYSYFPALVWLNNHGGVSPMTEQLVPSVIRALDSHKFGADPIDLIEDQVDRGDWANLEGEHLAKAWPRMWTALYLMSDSSLNSDPVFTQPDYAWSQLNNSEVKTWRNEMSSDGARAEFAEDTFSPVPRIGRLDGSPASLSLNEPTHDLSSIALAQGGAAFADIAVDSSPATTGFVRLTAASDDPGRTQKFEIAVTQYGSAGYPEVCLRSGEPQFKLSDGERNADGEAVIDVEIDDSCSNFTVAIVQVDPNSSSTDSVSVNLELFPSAEITTTTLPSGESGIPYVAQLQATVSGAWSMSGAPEGLTLSSSGELSGIPNGGGLYDVVVSFDASDGQRVSRTFPVIIAGPRFETDPSLPTAGSGPYSQQILTAVQGNPDQTTTISLVSGTLPSGLEIDSNGLISGTVTRSGIHNFTLQATDADGLTATKRFTIGTASRAHLQFRVETTPSPVVAGQPASGLVTVTNTGGLVATGRSAQLKLPVGFSNISAPGCTPLVGYPTRLDCPLADIAPGEALEFTVTFTVSAEFDPSTGHPILFADRSPVFADTGYLLAYLIEGESYGYQIVASDPDGDDADLVFSIVAGSLPPGFGMDPSGLITGIMQVNETDYIWDFTVRVVDGTGASETAELRLWINQNL